MGMDGLSMANTGVVKESTSADFANRTEQIMQADPSNDSKQVQTLSTNRRVREKDEDEENQKQQQAQQESEEFEDGFFQSEPEEKLEFDIEELENPNKDFTTDRLIETISGSELRELVKKLNMASGIFVNKKV